MYTKTLAEYHDLIVCFNSGRALTKISNCWVYAICSWGTEQLGSSFGSAFLFVSVKVTRDFAVAKENSRSLALVARTTIYKPG